MSTSSRTCHAMPLAVMFHTILVECPSVPLMGRARVSLSHGHPTAVELGLICRLHHLETGPPAACFKPRMHLAPQAAGRRWSSLLCCAADSKRASSATLPAAQTVVSSSHHPRPVG